MAKVSWFVAARLSVTTVRTYIGLMALALVLVLVEGTSYVLTEEGHYKSKLKNTLLYIGTSNEPIPPLENLPWPDEQLLIRLSDSDTSSSTYSIGGKNIPNAFLRAKTAFIESADLYEDSAIFIIGGSAAFGYPYHYAHTFAGILSHKLGSKYPVINAAQVGWSSGQLVPVVHRIVEHFPVKALIILCGNNEWVQWSHEPRNRWSRIRLRLYHLCSESYFLAYLAYHHLVNPARPMTKEQTPQGLLFRPHQELVGVEYAIRNPLEKFTAFDREEWLSQKQAILLNFSSNLNTMLTTSVRNRIPTILMNMPFKYKLSPSWKHPQPLGKSASSEELASILERINSEDTTDVQMAMETADSLLKEYPLSPILFYIKGTRQLAMGAIDDARESYGRAREQMIGNLGSMISINRIIARHGRAPDVSFIDLVNQFDKASVFSLNEDLIDDDCHPNISGHRIIGEALMQQFSTLLEVNEAE